MLVALYLGGVSAQLSTRSLCVLSACVYMMKVCSADAGVIMKYFGLEAPLCIDFLIQLRDVTCVMGGVVDARYDCE